MKSHAETQRRGDRERLGVPAKASDPGVGVEPAIAGFIRHCLERNGRTWPDVYDDMCWVAGRRLYRNLGFDDLRKLGLSLGLQNFGVLAAMVAMVEADPAGAHAESQRHGVEGGRARKKERSSALSAPQGGKVPYQSPLPAARERVRVRGTP